MCIEKRHATYFTVCMVQDIELSGYCAKGNTAINRYEEDPPRDRDRPPASPNKRSRPASADIRNAKHTVTMPTRGPFNVILGAFHYQPDTQTGVRLAFSLSYKALCLTLLQGWHL